ncbi:MAG TPA: hypothetical protein VM618_09860 [Acidimicrobiia bacterium]|nr:hypothetical protein [Acidimicrobiia bacterium]
MPTLRTYEAATVEEALAKVRQDLGAEARIVNAEKIRTGGIAGFFTRERYELKVEVPTGEPEPRDGVERAARNASEAATAASVHQARITSILDLVDKVSEEERADVPSIVDHAAAAAYRPSTEEPAFAAVMRRIASEAGLLDGSGQPVQPAQAETPATRDGEATAAPAPWLPLHVGAPTAEATVETTPLAPDAVDEITDEITDEGLPWMPAVDALPAGAGLVPAISFGGGADDAAADDAAESIHGHLATIDLTTGEGDLASAGTCAEVPATPIPRLRLVPDLALEAALKRPETALALPEIPGALVRLGLPGSLVPATASIDDLVPALLRELRRLPAIPTLPAHPGAVTCVTGERESALELARTISEELGLDPDDIVVASRRPAGRQRASLALHSAAAASEQARHWRAFGTSKVVAVPVAPGSTDTAWARRIIDAVQPQAVWGTADARRKVEDIGTWADALGGIDALAIDHVEETVSPASVLALGIPVAVVDERWASAALWALILAERVSTASAA